MQISWRLNQFSGQELILLFFFFSFWQQPQIALLNEGISWYQMQLQANQLLIWCADMNKLIVDTNDYASILKLSNITISVANIFFDIRKSQEVEVGDDVTSIFILTGESLKQI